MEGSALLKSEMSQMEDCLLGFLDFQLFEDRTGLTPEDFDYHLPNNEKNHRWGENRV
jgi:hypothetical protein